MTDDDDDDDKIGRRNVIPFGKYKGRLIEEVLVDDPNYLQWLTGQEWFRDRFVNLYQVIINRGAEADETPEHNALQALFLDDDFCLKFWRVIEPSLVTEAIHRYHDNLKRQKDEVTPESIVRRIKSEDENFEQRRLKGMLGLDIEEFKVRRAADLARCEFVRETLSSNVIPKIEAVIKRTFEEKGIDVSFHAHIFARYHEKFSLPIASDQFTIEIKPVVADDYPAVFRQMRANQSKILLLESYIGKGATREQLIAIFATAYFKVIFADDVRHAVNPIIDIQNGIKDSGRT